MIVFVICKRHRRLHYGRAETYNTYQRVDGGEQVITDRCSWKGAIFLSEGQANKAIRESRTADNDIYAQMVKVAS